MADALYVKVNGEITPVQLNEKAGGIFYKVFTSRSRDAVLTKGTEWSVPSYVMGDNSLSIFVNGLRCIKGAEYSEASTTSVTFSFDIPKDFELSAEVVTSTTDATRIVQTDQSRSAVLKAGALYTIPSYALGEQRLQVFLDGMQYRDFTEVSTTQISFDIDIPTTMEIVVVVN